MQVRLGAIYISFWSEVALDLNLGVARSRWVALGMGF